VGAVKLAGETAQPVDRGVVVGELPGGPQAALDDRAVALGQVVEDVAFSLKWCVLSSARGSRVGLRVVGFR
jgi:hypothetical protein